MKWLCAEVLCRQLLEDDQVLFSGYRVPHPLEPAIQVRVQTRAEKPGPVQVCPLRPSFRFLLIAAVAHVFSVEPPVAAPP